MTSSVSPLWKVTKMKYSIFLIILIVKIKSVVWDSKGEFMATCGRDKTVWVWDKDEGYEWSCNSILNGHSQVT
jgi:WD40 repeat protein